MLRSGGGISVITVKNATCENCGTISETSVNLSSGIILYDRRVRGKKLIYEIHNNDWRGDYKCCCSNCSGEWEADFVEREKVWEGVHESSRANPGKKRL